MTQDNYRELLTPLLTAGGGQGFCVNLSVDTSSVDIMELCREIGALYIDTVVEPWLGFYFDKSVGPEARSNYALRETLLAAKRKQPGRHDRGVLLRRQSRHGVVVRQAGAAQRRPRPRHRRSTSRRAAKTGASWRSKLGVKGIHIAERDTQRAKQPKPMDVFVNTWSVEGFVSEGLQPAELGWGTHEKWMPENGRTHETGCGAAIYLLQPGANTRVRSWSPTPRRAIRLPRHPQRVDLDRRLLHGARRRSKVVYRPTCHYAYHPCNDAVLSLHEMFGAAGKMQPNWHILDENEIVDGIDELGVLLYGHDKNAYWYGSQLSIEETRAHRALPERHRPAGDLGGAGRHGLGAGESERRHRRGRRDGFPPLPRNPDALSRPGDRLLHRLDAARRTAPACSRRTSTRRDPWQFRNVLVR